MEETKEYFSLNKEGTLVEKFRLVASHHSDKKILIYLRGYCQRGWVVRSSYTNTSCDGLWALRGECTHSVQRTRFSSLN